VRLARRLAVTSLQDRRLPSSLAPLRLPAPTNGTMASATLIALPRWLGPARPRLDQGPACCWFPLTQAGRDILIGGKTAYDSNNAALMAILAEWQSGDDYATRYNRLEGLQGGGLNGAYDLIWGGTVSDDNAKDRLVGSTTGLDWFFAQLSGVNLDTLVNLNAPSHEHLNNTL
jgi:hypothetical protein